MKKMDEIKRRFMGGEKKADPLAKKKNAFIGRMMKSKKAPCPA